MCSKWSKERNLVEQKRMWQSRESGRVLITSLAFRRAEDMQFSALSLSLSVLSLSSNSVSLLWPFMLMYATQSSKSPICFRFQCVEFWFLSEVSTFNFGIGNWLQGVWVYQYHYKYNDQNEEIPSISRTGTMPFRVRSDPEFQCCSRFFLFFFFFF